MCSESTFNNGIVSERDSLLVDLCETSLVNELLHVLQVRVTPCDVRGDPLKHLQSSLVETYEGSTVDLSQSKQLQNLSWLRCNLVDTLNSHNESKVGFSWYIERVSCLGLSGQSNLVSLLSQILFDVRLGSLENNLSLVLVCLLLVLLFHD